MKWIILNIIFLTVQFVAFSQDFPDKSFTHLSEKDGLSSNQVNCIIQDGEGIIWAGTANGLNRFDGYGFTKFYANPYDSNSIAGNEIPAIYSDHQNNLWLMTTGGLCRFNTVTQTATGFKSQQDTATPLRRYDGSQVWFDKNSDIPYIVSPSALYHFTNSGNIRTQTTNFPSFIFKGFHFTSYTKFKEDKSGQLWAFCQNRIYKIDNQTKNVINEFQCPDQDVAIYDVIFDRQGRCWASTWHNGIFIFDPATSRWSQLADELRPGVVVQSGVEWNWNGKHFMVFATNDPGLLLINEATLKSKLLKITDNYTSINLPFVDRQNILWVAASDGIYYYSPANNLFDIIPISASAQGAKDSLESSIAYDMREEESGYWIARRYNAGILWFDKHWNLLRSWPKIVAGFGPAYNDRIETTREGFDFKQQGQLMFVSTEWGMVSIDLHSFQKKIYSMSGTDPIMRLRTIVGDSDHKWWVRSFDQGVFIFNPQTGIFEKHYRLGRSCDGCSPPQANYLIRDRNGRIFETTNNGLYTYDQVIDSFVRVYPKGKLVLGTSLLGMAIDSAGLVWIGSDNGLLAYDPDSEKVVKAFAENNRIGQVQRITIDSEQNVWFNTVGGYWCWLRQRNKIIQFRYDQRLQSTDDGMFYTTANGDVYAGGTGAVIRFYPKRLMNYTTSSKTKIISAYANDDRCRFGYTKYGEKTLALNATQNNLQVQFDVINYDQLDNNLFFYKLLPGQKEWKQIDIGKLSFNNLSAGDYELSVRGGNKLTGKFTNTDVLYFSIKPRWFQTWWFILLCVFSGSVITFFIIKRRVRNIRKVAAFHQKIAETEMMALRSQMNPHFIFNSLNGIEYFILQNDKRHASVYLHKFASLIRIILANSRKDVVPFEDDLQTIRLYIDLELLRCNHNFEYITEIDPALDGTEYPVPPLLIQPFVENAIIHGFAGSDRKDLQLKVTVKLEGEFIKYIIEDNGVGRQEASLYNALNKPGHASMGVQITQQRISILNEQNPGENSLHFEDLFDENHHPKGTRVFVRIKII